MSDNIKEVGLRLNVDGTVDFKKSITAIKNEMNLASAEFKKATEAMDDNKNSIEKLTEAQKFYQQRIEHEKQLISALQMDIKDLSKDEEKNADAIAKKKIELVNAEKYLIKYEKSLGDVNSKLATSYQENQKLETELKKLGTQLEQVKADYDKNISALDKNATETAKLTEKEKLLKSQTDLQKQTVEDLQKQLDLLTESEEQNEEAIASKKLELTKAETELNNYQKELKETSDELSKHSEITDKLITKFDGIATKCTDIGKKMSVVSAGIGGVAAASISAFDEVDAGWDTIIKATGATGDAAVDLENVYKDVAGKVVGSFEDIGGAIGEVNTRFGYTGNELNQASTDFLKFAEITGNDAVSAVQLVSRAMGDAGIESSEYKDVLDALSVAGQASGISIDNLAGNITKYGAPMRALGYSTKESIAMFSSWEKAGVNTEIAFSGMKKAISNFSAEGKDAKVEFKKTLDEIAKCPDIASATTKAIEVFGAKAGPDLADAIQGGRFEFSEMLDLIENSSGTLDSTYDSLLDGTDDAKLAMQDVKLALAEVGETILTTVAPIIKKFSEKIKELAEWWKSLSPDVQKVIVIIAGIVAAIGPLLLLIGGIASGISALSAAIGALSAPVLIVIGVIGALIAIITYLWNTNEEFRNNVMECWSSIQEFFSVFLDWLGNVFGVGFDEKFGLFTAIFENFKTYISEAFSAILQIFQGVLDFLTGVFTGDWDKAFQGLSSILSGFQRLVDSQLTFIKNIFNNLSKWLGGIFSTDWTKHFGVFGNILNGFCANASNIINSVKNIFTGLLDFVAGVFTGNWTRAWEGVKSIFAGIMGGLASVIKAPLNAVIGLINACIDGLNRIKVSIPKWVPSYGGQSFGINIPKIPYLRKGIANVPYDDYLAYLHQGERVLTAEENRAYQRKQDSVNQKNVTYQIILNVDKIENSNNRDAETLAKDLQFYLKKLEEAKGN